MARELRTLSVAVSLALLATACGDASTGPQSAASLSGPRASGGSLAGGGGGGGGTVTPPAPAPCAQIVSYKVTTGKYQSWAAVWTNYSVKNCGMDESQTITVDEINTATGVVDFSRTWSGFLGASKSVSNVWDDDFGAWRTSYEVRITVTETATSAVLATQSAFVSTGVPKI